VVVAEYEGGRYSATRPPALEEFERIADQFPVFRIVPAASSAEEV